MFGDILRELRKDYKMTQAELAERLSLSPLTISAYECGRSVPDDTTKVKIAKIFNVSLDYLLGLIREPFPYQRSANTILLPPDFTPRRYRKGAGVRSVSGISKKEPVLEINRRTGSYRFLFSSRCGSRQGSSSASSSCRRTFPRCRTQPPSQAHSWPWWGQHSTRRCRQGGGPR